MRSAFRRVASSTIAWPIERARTTSAWTSTPWSTPSARASSSDASTRAATSVGSSPSRSYLRGTRTTVIASIAASRSFASAIAVATISSPMSPSFIGTRILLNSAPAGSTSIGVTCSSSPRRDRAPYEHEDDEPAASQTGPA